MGFLDKVEKLISEVEQNQTMQPAAPQPTNDPTNLTATQPANVPEEPEVEVTKLSPESEVLLVRLIKKALATKIEPSDINELGDLEDINEKNAKEALKRFINIMKKYSSDIDVTT